MNQPRSAYSLVPKNHLVEFIKCCKLADDQIYIIKFTSLSNLNIFLDNFWIFIAYSYL